MDQKLKSALKVDSKFHDDLLDHCKKLVEMSRAHMSSFYDTWDANDATIRGERIADEQDRKAARRGEPTKMVLPFTYAQVQTFIAFFTLLFNQRSNFFEIQDNGNGEYTPEGDAQIILDKDLCKNMFSMLQYQCYLNLARSGFCVIKSGWESEEIQIKAPSEAPIEDLFGVGATPEDVKTTKFKYQCNKLRSISPYKFFPDIRLPLSRFQEGEFCASEDEYSITKLKLMEANGDIANVGAIADRKTTGEAGGSVGIRRLNEYLIHDDNVRTSRPNTTLSAGMAGSGMAIVTEAQVWISAKDFKDDNGSSPLGSEDKPELYVVWYANDKTILKAEKMNYDHNQFCYDLGEYSADQIRVVNESLAEIVDPLQSVATWMLNARITSVRKNIDNKFVVDPSGLELKDLIDRSPIIRLKPGMARSGVKNWIEQLQVTDVTTNHVNDVQTLWSFMQISTGINDNALGQYNGGRRSAAEARTVNAGAASRLKTIASVLWETLFTPLGKKMLSNLGNNLSLQVFQQYVGKTADEARFQAFKNELDSYSFEFFDGTAPSEKGYIAQSMQDLLLGLLSNPMAAQMLSQEPFRSLVVEIADLRGIRSPERFLPPALPPAPPVAPIDPNAQPEPTPSGGPTGIVAAPVAAAA